MENQDLLSIEIVYAENGRADRTVLMVEPETSFRMAVQRSGLPGRHPGLNIEEAGVGVFGRLRRLDEIVKDGDRVEVYRRLEADPKQARRQRVRIARRTLPS